MGPADRSGPLSGAANRYGLLVTIELQKCPACAAALVDSITLALCRREEDGARVCKRVRVCSTQLHGWWRWNDRPETEYVRNDTWCSAGPN